MIFPTNVQGIPCQCEVISMTAYDPGRTTGPVERCYPPEGGEIEFLILDRQGYHAPWLERKLTSADQARIEEEIHVMSQADQFEEPAY